MVSLTVKVSGLNEVTESTFSKIKDPKLHEAILDEALSILLNRVRQRFLSEVDPDGQSWIPSAAGLKRRSGGYTYRNGRKYTGTGTLFESGTLFHSIQAFRGEEPFSRVIKTDVPYAKHLQHGENEGPWIFLGFGGDDLTLFENLVLKRVKEAIA